MSAQDILLYSLMLAAGFGIPLMAAINADLGTHLGSTFAAVCILSFVALIFSLIGMAVTDVPTVQAAAQAPLLDYFAGALFVLYMASITYCAPRIGLGNAVFLVLLGQLFCAAAIDHFALLNAPAFPLTPRRALGLLLMTLGIYLARSNVSETMQTS